MTTSVLITGGTGRTARQLIDTLLNRPDCPPLRILVRPQGVEALRESFPLLFSSPHSIFAADYMDEETLNPAFQDVSIVVHNGPNIHQNEVVSPKQSYLCVQNDSKSPRYETFRLWRFQLSKPPKKQESVSLFFAVSYTP